MIYVYNGLPSPFNSWILVELWYVVFKTLTKQQQFTEHVHGQYANNSNTHFEKVVWKYSLYNSNIPFLE